jgi:hypothetical protein
VLVPLYNVISVSLRLDRSLARDNLQHVKERKTVLFETSDSSLGPVCIEDTGLQQDEEIE